RGNSKRKSVSRSKKEGTTPDSRTVHKRRRVWKTTRSDTTTTDEDTEEDYKSLERRSLLNMGNKRETLNDPAIISSGNCTAINTESRGRSFRDVLVQGENGTQVDEEESDEDDAFTIEWEKADNPLPDDVGWGDWAEDYAEEEEE